MEAMRVGAEKLLNLSLDEGRRADKAEAERDALKAAVRKYHTRDDSNPRGPWCNTCLTVWPCATLAALAAPESHGDERTPQNLGTGEGQEDGPPCNCRAFDGHGQNPECDAHPWWRTDPPVLHLADLTRELGSAWDAARKLFGGSA
jgi:hypothetical protein